MDRVAGAGPSGRASSGIYGVSWDQATKSCSNQFVTSHPAVTWYNDVRRPPEFIHGCWLDVSLRVHQSLRIRGNGLLLSVRLGITPAVLTGARRKGWESWPNLS